MSETRNAVHSPRSRIDSLGEQINAYDDEFARLDDELTFYADRKRSFNEIIRLAACGLDSRGKMHQHQCLPGRAVCEEAAGLLQEHSAELRDCNSFEELLAAIMRLTDDVRQFGRLCQYDTALRIGMWMGRQPEYIYLQRGSLAGANTLRLRITRSPLARWRIIEPVPPALQLLQPYQAENFLCWIH